MAHYRAESKGGGGRREDLYVKQKNRMFFKNPKTPPGREGKVESLSSLFPSDERGERKEREQNITLLRLHFAGESKKRRPFFS